MKRLLANLLERRDLELAGRLEFEKSRMCSFARKLGLSPLSVRYILSGSEPKVAIALSIARELGFPVTDWELPAGDKVSIDPSALVAALDGKPVRRKKAASYLPPVQVSPGETELLADTGFIDDDEAS